MKTCLAPNPTFNRHTVSETFAWNQDGNLLIETYYPMPEHVGADNDPYAYLLRWT